MAATRVDETVLRALYTEHGAALLGYATRLCEGDRGRAEDVVQETLLRAWQHPDALAPERGSVRAWLFTVARNLAVDAHRARSARPAEIGPAPLEHLAVDDDVERALDAWLVGEALATLTDAHRAVVVETFFRGCSVAEAAARLGVPPGTIKSRAYYALRALRVALAERGVES
ncbi:sigma-70 family RNA polymerase sigma factor [Pengzhenrongella sicca]|uniref:RNA polymerase sigma factor n=1 Tax=Pengzhenrongella sicca TaxID=2819238 RepID=A0A8A4ZDS4_9MICO|nr:sigma-70 family RNA polymerase sigma factor [Pengzhenrongella sicca]QTE29465.1 sigma-70 family RNA polymerase sigma factor [Pengzhenrongella sicca]